MDLVYGANAVDLKPSDPLLYFHSTMASQLLNLLTMINACQDLPLAQSLHQAYSPIASR
jgi:hypothetical protein